MKLDEFLALDYQEKLQTTRQAVCIGSRSNAKETVLLYQLDTFYIEVFYNKSCHYISDFHAFENTDLLEPYLRKIEISLTY